MKTNKVRWEGVITNIQSNILLALARYKFLTISQLLHLNIGTTQKAYLWKQLASLRDRSQPLVKRQQFSITQALNGKPPRRIEDWYFLNNNGKKALVENLAFDGQIKMPVGRKSIASKDYQHRRHTIDFQIELDLWAKSANIKIPFFHTYFEKVGNARIDKNLRAKTRIDFDNGNYFIPDGAFSIIHNQGEKFFLMEMYQGNDTKRTISQLHKHALSMTKRYTHKAYQLPAQQSYNIVLIFQHQSLKDAVINRIQTNGHAFSIIQKYFRCKHYEELQGNEFYTNWTTLHGEPVNLY